MVSPSAFNLRPPLYDQVVSPSGVPTDVESKWRSNLTLLLQQISPILVSISGGDATAGLNQAIGQAQGMGGGVVVLPAGNYTISSPIAPSSTSPPIWIIGQGPATILTRSAAMTPGMGMFDVSSDYFTMSDFVIDGGTTSPVGLQYGSGFSTSLGANDPMAPSLTNNTSVWVHGPNTGFSAYRMRFQHAAGYSIIFDALTGDVTDPKVIDCFLVNNRPTLFGTSSSDLNYGSWNGGILAKSDGRAASGSQSGIVAGLQVSYSNFQRNTGNCAWSHGYGFQRYNSEFRYLGNRFLDCGLDGILCDILSGGSVEGNVMRRIGYTTLTDTDQSVPRWLANLNATGLDSGIVKGVNYLGNSFTSCNGGAIDLDTHMMGSITGNICRIPFSDEPEYTEDQIAITGPTNSGNASYGLNLAVNYPVNEGGSYLDITGNTILNMPSGAMRLYAARFCNVIGNVMSIPVGAPIIPILLGPNGAASYNRCYGNRVAHNQFADFRTTATAVIAEDNSLSGGHNMTSGEINYCFGNIILENASAIEFSPISGSGSVAYSRQIWFP